MANKIYKRLGLRRDQDLGDVDNSKQALNNILDGYPWLQSYLGAYILGGAGSLQMRVVRG